MAPPTSTEVTAPYVSQDLAHDFSRRIPSRLWPLVDIMPALDVACGRTPRWNGWARFGCYNDLLQLHPDGELAYYGWLRRRECGSEVGVYATLYPSDTDPASVWERLLSRGDVPPELAPSASRTFRRAVSLGQPFSAAAVPADTPGAFEEVVSFASDARGLLRAEALAADALAKAGLSPLAFDWVCGERLMWQRHGPKVLFSALGGEHPLVEGANEYPILQTGALLELAMSGYMLAAVDESHRRCTLWRPTLFETTWPHGRPARRRRRR